MTDLGDNPYPRRTELPTQERVLIARIDETRHRAAHELNDLLEEAHTIYPTDKLYAEATYLPDYVNNLTPLSNDTDDSFLKKSAEKSKDTYVTAYLVRDAALQAMTTTVRRLFQPVPDMTDARVIKQGNLPKHTWYNPNLPETDDYRSVEIENDDEPMVSLAEYGIYSKSYYSRPNGVTGGAPVPGVKPEVYVRKSIAEKLVQLNENLKRPEITGFFGGEVELFVDEGYRDPAIQRDLHDIFIPELIMSQLAQQKGLDCAQLTDEERTELEKEMTPIRDQKIARPSPFGEGTPGPHQTGSAVDLTIRYKQDTAELVPRVNIWFGKEPTNLTKVTDPDHFEHRLPTNEEELVAQQNLRAWHALLLEVGLLQNPTEFWHAGAGDQLSAVHDGEISKVTARFGWPAVNPNTYTPPKDK